MPSGRGDTGQQLKEVFRNRSLRRVLLAFGVFRPTGSATWIAILVAALATVSMTMTRPAGVGKSFFDVTARTLLQRSVDDDVLARVFGVHEGLSMAALAVCSMAAPALVTGLGAGAAFVLAGLWLPLVVLVALRRIRLVDREAVVASPADISLLRGTSIFGPLGPASLERVARYLIPVDARAGTVVIREGEPGDRFYLIAHGSLLVSRGGAELAILRPGDFVGEIALLRDVPRTATVTATTASSLRALDREHFLAAVTGSPVGAVALAEEMDRRLAEHDELEA